MGYDYRELRVWNKAMALAELTYELSNRFPIDERFGLTSQVRRAMVSIASNIAEGQGRSTRGEFRQFLGHARGSIYEARTQMELAARLGYIDDDTHNGFESKAIEVGNHLNALILSLGRSRNTKHETRNN